jgi:hypothetical protein
MGLRLLNEKTATSERWGWWPSLRVPHHPMAPQTKVSSVSVWFVTGDGTRTPSQETVAPA